MIGVDEKCLGNFIHKLSTKEGKKKLTQTIFKYNLDRKENILDLPETAQVLHVGVQFDGIKIWVKLDDSVVKIKRCFYVFLTGENFNELPGEMYFHLGTVHYNGLVKHVFEKLLGFEPVSPSLEETSFSASPTSSWSVSPSPTPSWSVSPSPTPSAEPSVSPSAEAEDNDEADWLKDEDLSLNHTSPAKEAWEEAFGSGRPGRAHTAYRREIYERARD